MIDRRTLKIRALERTNAALRRQVLTLAIGYRDEIDLHEHKPDEWRRCGCRTCHEARLLMGHEREKYTRLRRVG